MPIVINGQVVTPSEWRDGESRGTVNNVEL